MTGNGKYNGNGHHPPDDGENEKVVRFPSLAERDRKRREEQKRNRPPREPMINLPLAAKFLVLSFILIHLALQFVPEPGQYWIYDHFGFVAGRYTGRAEFGWYALIAPFTYMFLHGGWMHLILNTFMTAAFGAGVERLMGPRRMLVFFVLCSLAAVLVQFALSPFSTDPVIGASGGLSGFFAAILILMQKMGVGGAGRYGIWPFVALWVAISVLFGMMGAPGGGAVAWAAHLGGFAAGFLLLKPVMRYMK